MTTILCNACGQAIAPGSGTRSTAAGSWFTHEACAPAWRGGARECIETHADGRCGCRDSENRIAGEPHYCALRYGGDR